MQVNIAQSCGYLWGPPDTGPGKNSCAGFLNSTAGPAAPLVGGKWVVALPSHEESYNVVHLLIICGVTNTLTDAATVAVETIGHSCKLQEANKLLLSSSNSTALNPVPTQHSTRCY